MDSCDARATPDPCDFARPQTIDDLKEMAPKLNPIVGYWNPLGIGEDGFDDIYVSTLPESSRSVISWFRAAEIKHGRVAMAAFVGFIVGENGIHFPWALQGGQCRFIGKAVSMGGAVAPHRRFRGSGCSRPS